MGLLDDHVALEDVRDVADQALHALRPVSCDNHPCACGLQVDDAPQRRELGREPRKRLQGPAEDLEECGGGALGGLREAEALDDDKVVVEVGAPNSQQRRQQRMQSCGDPVEGEDRGGRAEGQSPLQEEHLLAIGGAPNRDH